MPNRQIAWIWLTLVAIGLAACASLNPLGKAETVEQKAFATFGLFVITQETAADLLESGTVPDSIARGIILANREANLVVNGPDGQGGALAIFKNYRDARRRYEQGGISLTLLMESVGQLESTIDSVRTVVENFSQQVKGAQ